MTFGKGKKDMFEEVEEQLEDLSFVKGTGKKDRNKNDPFAQLGL